METWIEYESPLGSLLVIANGKAVTELWLPDTPQVGMPERFVGSREAAKRDRQAGATPILEEAIRQLDTYFGGSLRTFTLPLGPAGTAFQQRVWQELCSIPYGATISYGDLARRVGDPKASRAVGYAIGRNPLPIVIPCHRVIAADGSLGGYSGGLCNKEVLLRLEGATWISPRPIKTDATLSLFAA